MAQLQAEGRQRAERFCLSQKPTAQARPVVHRLQAVQLRLFGSQALEERIPMTIKPQQLQLESRLQQRESRLPSRYGHIYCSVNDAHCQPATTRVSTNLAPLGACAGVAEST